MRVCPTCGSQVPENMNFCSNCGTAFSEPAQAETPVQAEPTVNATQAYETNPNEQTGGTGFNSQRPTVQQKSIATWIILSIVTCGICGIVWFINMVNDVNAVCQDEKSKTGGGTVFILTLVTCGIYGWIWFFNCGKRMAAAGAKYNMDIKDNSVMYLILMLVGLGIVDYALIQSDLNKFAQ